MSVKVVRWPLRKVKPGESERFPDGLDSEVVEILMIEAEFDGFMAQWDALKGMPEGATRDALARELCCVMELRHLLDASFVDEGAQERAKGPGGSVSRAEQAEAVTDAQASVESLEARGFRIPGEVKAQLALGQLAIGSDQLREVAAPAGNELARAARDEAIRRVDRAADPAWRDKAHDAIRSLATRQQKLVSDDVWTLLGWQPEEPRAIGPVMLRAAAQGYIEKIPGETREGNRAVNHARPQQVWRSLIYEGGHGDSGQAA